MPTSEEARDLPPWLARAGTEPTVPIDWQVETIDPRPRRETFIEDDMRCR